MYNGDLASRVILVNSGELMKGDLKRSILDALLVNPDGMTLQTISSSTGIHRHTVRKYVHELHSENRIHVREIGRAKLCYAK